MTDKWLNDRCPYMASDTERVSLWMDGARYARDQMERKQAAASSSTTEGWRKWPEEKPEELDLYLCTVRGEDKTMTIILLQYDPEKIEWSQPADDRILAWRTIDLYTPTPPNREGENTERRAGE